VSPIRGFSGEVVEPDHPAYDPENGFHLNQNIRPAPTVS
jgi:hypothetical protein